MQREIEEMRRPGPPSSWQAALAKARGTRQGRGLTTAGLTKALLPRAQGQHQASLHARPGASEHGRAKRGISRHTPIRHWTVRTCHRSPSARVGDLWRTLTLGAQHSAALCGTRMQSAAPPGTRRPAGERAAVVRDRQPRWRSLVIDEARAGPRWPHLSKASRSAVFSPTTESASGLRDAPRPHLG
jgi:hypothetical protein